MSQLPFFEDDDGVDGQVTDSSDASQRRDRRRPSSGREANRRRRSIVSLVMMLAILGGLVFLGARVLPPLFAPEETATVALTDYPGPGEGEVEIVIPEGATGAAIGQILQQAGVVATVDAFTAAHAANAQATSIQPGTYQLMREMRAADAVVALLDPNRRLDLPLTIPEGWRSDQVYQRIAESFGVPVADVEAAAHDYAALGLTEAPNTNPEAIDPMEGWWYPDTYRIGTAETPADLLRRMYERSVAELDALGVAPEDRLRVLTAGSIAMREADEADYGKVTRVIENRMLPENLGDFPTLGMDSTLRYGKQRLDPTVDIASIDHNGDQSPYNTREFAGLPPSPIGAVDAPAMAAAVTPEEGPWLWFVTVNLCTRETIFTDDSAVNDQITAQFRAWNQEWEAGGRQC